MIDIRDLNLWLYSLRMPQLSNLYARDQNQRIKTVTKLNTSQLLRQVLLTEPRATGTNSLQTKSPSNKNILAKSRITMDILIVCQRLQRDSGKSLTQITTHCYNLGSSLASSENSTLMTPSQKTFANFTGVAQMLSTNSIVESHPWTLSPVLSTGSKRPVFRRM